MTTKPNISNWQSHDHKAQHQTDSHMTTKPNISSWQSHDHKAQHVHIKRTVTWPQSPTYQADSHMTTKPNISSWQSYDHKAQHIKLTVTWPQSPTYQADSHMTTKPNISNWQSHDHKAQHIKLTVTWPQSPTYQTDSHMTTKPNISNWQPHDCHGIKGALSWSGSVLARGEEGRRKRTNHRRSSWRGVMKKLTSWMKMKQVCTPMNVMQVFMSPVLHRLWCWAMQLGRAPYPPSHASSPALYIPPTYYHTHPLLAHNCLMQVIKKQWEVMKRGGGCCSSCQGGSNKWEHGLNEVVFWPSYRLLLTYVRRVPIIT